MKSKGFTLIELLVVISIISLLSSIVLSTITTARVKARDAKRLGDLRQFQNAVQLCFEKQGNYNLAASESPLTTPCTRELTSDVDFVNYWTANCSEFMKTPPVDSTIGYTFHTSSDYQHYALLTQLEGQTGMSSAQVTAYLANIGITGWAQCANYNYVIGQ
jgi:prepilin-type N-terminal cleavage/methylation domain-containing protein